MPVVNGVRCDLHTVQYLGLSKAYYPVLMNENTVNHNNTLFGGKAISLRDMLSEIGNGLGKKVNFVSCLFPIAYAGVCLSYWATLKNKDYQEKVQRLCEPRAYLYYDATQDFGYSPGTFKVDIVDDFRGV